MTDRRSLVTAYAFPTTLEAQEAALATNPLMRRLIEYRKSYAGDRFRPAYHYVNPESVLNDPNGLCRWQGRWHLFYQGYPPEESRWHWGPRGLRRPGALARPAVCHLSRSRT